jgi:hypothetical protein
MTNPPIQDLNLTDLEYAQLISQGYDPELERQLVALGQPLDKARKMAVFWGLLKGKTLESQEEREELLCKWNKIWGIKQTHDGHPGAGDESAGL